MAHDGLPTHCLEAVYLDDAPILGLRIGSSTPLVVFGAFAPGLIFGLNADPDANVLHSSRYCLLIPLHVLLLLSKEFDQLPILLCQSSKTCSLALNPNRSKSFVAAERAPLHNS